MRAEGERLTVAGHEAACKPVTLEAHGVALSRLHFRKIFWGHCGPWLGCWCRGRKERGEEEARGN